MSITPDVDALRADLLTRLSESSNPSFDASWVRDTWLDPSGVARFIDRKMCEQFYKYEIGDATPEVDVRSINPVLSKDGKHFENEVVDEIRHGADVTDEPGNLSESKEMFLDAVAQQAHAPAAADPIVIPQFNVSGIIGVWKLSGDADLVYVWGTEDESRVRVRIIDVKASHDEKTYHQMQVAIYSILLRNFLSRIGIDDTDVEIELEGGVIFRDEERTELMNDDSTLRSHSAVDKAAIDAGGVEEAEMVKKQAHERIEQEGQAQLGNFGESDDIDKDEAEFIVQMLGDDRLRSGDYTDINEFDLTPRELDIHRLLEDGGRFERISSKDETDIRYQLGPKCLQCPYQDECYTNAIEGMNSALLGLTGSVQSFLESEDVGSIQDIASMGYATDSDAQPFDYGPSATQLRSGQDIVRKLAEKPGIGGSLRNTVAEAQALLGKVNPRDQHAYNFDRLPWLPGSGNPALPAVDDDDDLIRVYLHVQADHRRDRMGVLSGYVTASEYTTDDDGPDAELFSVAHPPSQDEGECLSDAFTQMFGSIERVASGLGKSDTDNTFVHFYMYSSEEREALFDAIERNTDKKFVDNVRDLLSSDDNIARSEQGQAMLSIIESEINQHVAMPVPNTGLIPVMRELGYPYEDRINTLGWEYTRSDGVSVDFRQSFRKDFFDTSKPYSAEGDEVNLGASHRDADGWYPFRTRTSQYPVAYLWAAFDIINEEWSSLAEDDDAEGGLGERIKPFVYHDVDEFTHEISVEDVRELGIRLANCAAHVERTFYYRDSFMTKKSVPLNEISKFKHQDPTLARACTEFLDLEYGSGRQDTDSLCAKTAVERIRAGDSVPLKITSATATDERMVVEGRLVYDRIFAEDPQSVANACSIKDGDSGERMVATKVNPNADGLSCYAESPHEILSGVPISVEEYDPENNYIRFSALPNWISYGSSRFTEHHDDWVVNGREVLPEESGQTMWDFSSGDWFVLDPQIDDPNSEKYFNVLQESSENPVYNDITDILRGEDAPTTNDAFNSDAVGEYVDWIHSPSPNERQAEFIKKTDAKYSLLQGPPGTGKTAGAMSSALLARSHSFEVDNKSFTGSVTGASHKSIDEVLEDVASEYADYKSDPSTDTLDDLMLVRLGREAPSNRKPWMDEVDYVSLYKDTTHTVQTFNEILSRLGSAGGNPPRHLIVFSTPTGFYNLMNKVAQESSIAKSDDLEPFQELVLSGSRYFDTAAIDEGSMYQLPQFFTAGAFLKDNGQVLVGGDQRQMPPVLKHDWENERRRTVMEYAPFLSTLNYLRFLRGDHVELLDRLDNRVMDSPKVGDGIAMTRLERTYRCHAVIADFLNKHMYSQDGIEYVSGETDVIDDPNPITEGLAEVLDPEKPLTLVIHDESGSRQMNEVETAIIEGISDSLDLSNEDVGVVTPHNAQRGFVESRIEDVDVDTVERFQGDSRDTIVVSATASDPDFLNSETDFILNPNRLNVSVSRMKKQNVVVMSQSVPDLIPSETESYELSLLWKSLIQYLDVPSRDPEWDGSLRDLLGDKLPDGSGGYISADDADTNIEVYSAAADSVSPLDE